MHQEPSVIEALAPCIVAVVFGGIALYGLRTGKLPARGGGTVERRKTPGLFRILSIVLSRNGVLLFVCLLRYVASCFIFLKSSHEW